MGYIGIFVLMFLESTVFPIPSELVMTPAGYLAHKNEMNFLLALLAGIIGSIGGAGLNYYVALRFGRKFLLKYGHFVLFSEKTMLKTEEYFKNHGHISTFSGRLIPVLRHFISIPAGLAKMNVPKFVFYTGLGAGLWCLVLMVLGYFLGENEALIKEYLTHITIATVALVAIGLFVYFRLKRPTLQS